jgi:tRNA threonylcarbamoyladenosine biosynthesis protein TsaB
MTMATTMARILCIETSTLNCSVALAECGGDPVGPSARVIALDEAATENYSHAEKLHVMIDGLVRDAGLSPSDLDAIAIGSGPGSFTGLRIGAAAAKGMCCALGIPLIAVSTLKLLVLQGRDRHPEARHIVPALDARRMEIYTFDSDGAPVAVVVDSNFKADLEGRAVLIGDGSMKCQDVLADAGAWTFDDSFPSAAALCVPATARFTAGKFEDLATFEPGYLKAFVAGRPKDPLGLRNE